MTALLNIILPVLYSILFFKTFPTTFQFGLFIVGVFLGYSLTVIDRVIHAFFLYPDHEFNILVRNEWNKKNIFGVLKVLHQADTLQEKLLTRSAVFLIVYIVLACFVLTSTGSAVGIGLMLGMGLRYTSDFWRYRQHHFVRQFLWQVKHSFSQKEVDWIVLGWTVGFVVVSLATAILV